MKWRTVLMGGCCAIIALGGASCDSMMPMMPVTPGNNFDTASLIRFDSTGKTAISGILDATGVHVYRLGPFLAGDSLRITVDAAAGSALDPTIAIFNANSELLGLNDDVNLDSGQLGSAIDQILTANQSDVFLVISKFFLDTQGGGYTGTLEVNFGVGVTIPAVQVLVLNFDGGSVTIPNEGAFQLFPFDAADIDDAYDGDTDDIIDTIIDTVEDNFRNTGLVIITSDDPIPPGCVASTLHFGAFSSTKFGAAQAVDTGNLDHCDDGIIYTDDIDKPFAVQPSTTGIAVAIGNIAAHEAGHLLGLNHVSDITDLMDNTGSASTLLEDQEFKTSGLSPSVFPIGLQNGPLLLEMVVP